jgi:hypothetical protein
MLPPGTNPSRLLSSGSLDTHQGKGAAKGAMKGSKEHKIGPLRTTEARHVDGQMLKLQFQVWKSSRTVHGMLLQVHTLLSMWRQHTLLCAQHQTLRAHRLPCSAT